MPEPMDHLLEPRIDPHRFVLMGLLLLVLGAGFAATHRRPWSDEGWFASPSYNLAYHGYMGTTVLENAGRNLPNIQERTYWAMPLYMVCQAAWFKLFGHGMVSARALSILWAIVAALAFYVLVNSLTADRFTAALAVVLFSSEYTILDVASFARPEIMCLALGLAGIASYLSLRSTSLIGALVVGNIFACLSGLTHPNGILHLAALAVTVLLLDRERIRFGMLVACAVPYIVLGSLWLAYAAQDWVSFTQQLTGNSQGRVQLDWNPLVVIWRELYERYFFAYGLRSPTIAAKLKAIVLFSYMLAFVGILSTTSLRRTKPAMIALALSATAFAIQCVFNQKLSYYIAHIVPWLCFVLAILMSHLWRLRRQAVSAAVLAWLVLLCTLQVGGMVYRSRARLAEMRAMTAAVDFVKERAPAAKLIIGTAALSYEFDFDSRLLDDNYLGVRSRKSADVIILEEIYLTNLRDWRTARPADSEKINAVLARYQKVHDEGGYQVYFRGQ